MELLETATGAQDKPARSDDRIRQNQRMKDIPEMLLNKKASIRRGREKGAKVNQTFFDLIVHWERVIRLHVGRNQDLSRVLQHLKIENERNLNTQLFLIYPMCCGVIFISYYIFTAEIRDAMNLCNKTSQMNLSKRENQVLKKELV